jgi:hypothetical protein
MKMNKADIKIGNWYIIVSYNITRVRIISVSSRGGWAGVLKNGREIHIRNAGRLLGPIEKMKKEYSPSYFAEKMSGLADAAKHVATEEQIFSNYDATGKAVN